MFRRSFWRVGTLGLEGSKKSAYITVLARDADSNIILCTLTATNQLPNQVAGYAVGCILIDQQASAGTIYSNRGTALLCTFTQVNT